MFYERELPTVSASYAADAAPGLIGECERFPNHAEPAQQGVAQELRRCLDVAHETNRLREAFDIAPRPLPPFAKFDHSSIVIVGLFSSLNRNAAPPDGRVEFKWSHSDGDDELVVSCGSQLSDSDQRVLRGLVAHATDEYAAMGADRVYGRAPVFDPKLKVRVRCTLERLAEVAGFGSPGAGPTNTVIRKSLARLCDVKLTWRKATDGGGAVEEMLITSDGALKGHGAVSVTFHSRLQAAILASRQGEQYLKIGMEEARALRGPIARMLHHRLTHMNEGASTLHGAKTLEGYLWRGEALTRYAQRNRKAQLIKAILDLQEVGWKFDVSKDHPGCFEVTRPVANSFRPAMQPPTPGAVAGVSKD